ncbi:MAG: hypothetical protein CRN43_13990, partial [Candidatus Nephrothrix sp. EaCA]
GAIFHSADGVAWSQKTRKLTNLEAREGTLYIKITPYGGGVFGGQAGFYSLKIDITVGTPCAYSLSKSSAEVPGNASEGTFEVATGSACSWTSSSNAADWITLRPASGTGNTTVTYSVTQSAGAERTGTITIGGQTFTVKQSAVTGFETVSPVKIYPNPAKDFITIDLSGSGVKYASLKMANQLGQVIYETEHPGRAVKIPLKGLASGLYFIFLQGEEKTAVQKLIIND